MIRSSHRRGSPADVDRALVSLASMRIDALRRVWNEWFESEPPPCPSAELLRRLIAWRLQEDRFGGLPADAKRRLRQMRLGNKEGAPAAPAPILLKPGTMITREWRGVVQRVHVLENGFAHEGKHYRSLSHIARTITGKRWSGPRFFALEADKARAAVGNGTPAVGDKG